MDSVKATGFGVIRTKEWPTFAYAHMTVHMYVCTNWLSYACTTEEYLQPMELHVDSSNVHVLDTAQSTGHI